MRAAGTAPADAEAEIAIKGYVKELGWHTEQLERLNREEVEMCPPPAPRRRSTGRLRPGAA